MPPSANTDSGAITPGNAPSKPTKQHGVKGVYYAGEWLDIEDCEGVFNKLDKKSCSTCEHKDACPRSKSRNAPGSDEEGIYDVIIIGAGCIGSAIARELSRYSLDTVLVEAADDVSQGATKGNSGIVHAGYDDTPGTNHAKFCWPGNQMFPQLDKELRFGYQKNGSLVLAQNEKEIEILKDLVKRGETNGVQRLKILNKEELHDMEPHVNPNCIAALHSPDAGNVIPYEFTIALAENAVDNGVELRIRREVTAVEQVGVGDNGDSHFSVTLRHWEPKQYIDALQSSSSRLQNLAHLALVLCLVKASAAIYSIVAKPDMDSAEKQQTIISTVTVMFASVFFLKSTLSRAAKGPTIARNTTMEKLVPKATTAEGSGGKKVSVSDMLKGGSGWVNSVKGDTVNVETVKARFVINCAGGASDEIARMIGDDSFKIKPRLGDYLLLNRNQGFLTTSTLFPCPDPVLGKGVLVQTTLWGNLILGPTARDVYKPEARDMSDESVQEYILSKCKKLVPYFNPKETIHAFCGARAKSDRGDWIIEASEKNKRFIHVAGIDSPGLAGSPAIALEVVRLLKNAGLSTPRNLDFNPNREPIITPKSGMRGLKMGPVGKNDSDGLDEQKMAANIICKCEKVTELEVVRAIRRSLPIDSTQAIRKRTRAGMGHCQGDPENYNCEARVKAIIARENRVPINQVGGRPWPATSTLTKRWIDDAEKQGLKDRMGKD